MNHLLRDSLYYANWKKHTHLKDSAIYTYSRQFMKFEAYLSLDFEGELDFDKFYYDTESETYRPIDADCIDGYIEFLKQSYQASKNTLFNNIVYLKHFFTLLHGLGMIKQNPMKNFPNPYYERRIIDRSLSLEECQRLFQAALKADPFVRKYFNLFLLMTTTAVRNREIIQLTFEQIDFDRRVIMVNKGQKTTSEVVYMPDSLVEELERYIHHPVVEEWRKSGHSEVFFENNHPLSKEVLNRIIKNFCLNAGIQKKVTAHSFRHTTAYLMQKSGIDIIAIKRQLRHKQLSTTLRYVTPVDVAKLLNDACSTLN